MKKIKLFSIVAAFVAAFAFTSCNTGDDNNSYYQPLTQAEKDVCYLKTAGVHYGKLAYMSDEHVTEIKGTKEYIDTLDVTTEIYGNGKDTVMTVRNFPVKILARYIPELENADTKELKEALKKCEMQVNFKSVVTYYTVTPVLQFLLYPETMTVNLEYGGTTHKVNFYVYANAYYIYNTGLVDSKTSKLEAYFALYGYEVDPKDEKNPKPTVFSYNIAGKPYTGAQIKFFEPQSSEQKK